VTDTTDADLPSEPQPELSIVLPVFGSAAFLSESLGELSAYVAVAAEPTEVIVVDDGSPDASAAIAQAHVREWPADSRLRIARHGVNRGKGAAVRTGMLLAQGRQRVFTDADLAYGVEPIDRLRAALDAGADVAAGCRPTHRGFGRRLAGWAFRRVVASRGLLVSPDPQCGIKAFTGDAAARLFGLSIVDGFAFDVEILHVASLLGLTIEFVPVVEREGERVSSVRMLRDAPRMIRALDAIAVASRADRYVESGRGGVTSAP